MRFRKNLNVEFHVFAAYKVADGHSEVPVSAEIPDLAAKVNAARDAVKDLDEPLKTEGFKIVLGKLLAGSEPSAESPSITPKRARANRSGRNEQKKKLAPTVSSLRLDVAQLRELKAYCQKFELGGSEQITFVLANFIREHTDLPHVTAADIAYLYRQLVSQRVSLPAINDVGDFSRALAWLTAPSRKKEWLEKSGEGYVVSNSGLLRLNELEAQAAKPES